MTAYAFIESTALSSAPMMGSRAWGPVLEAIDDGRLHAAIPLITLMEIDRQAAKQIRSATAILRKWAAIDVGSVPPPSKQPMLSAFDIVPIPSVAHDVLLERDLDVRKPFDAAGKGYRDALIWHSLLDWLETLTTPAEVYFVTDNKSDFLAKGDELHDELRSDLADGVTLTVCRNLFDLARQLPAAAAPADQIEPPDFDELVAITAKQAIEQYLMEDVNIALEDLPWELEDPSIFSVYVDEARVRLLYEDPGVSTRWEVHATADVEVHGGVHKGDAVIWDWPPPAGLSLSEANDHYLDAEGMLLATVDAEIELDADRDPTLLSIGNYTFTAQ